MKERRRRQLLTEPPASATGDIAFNLIIFFLVCASVQPDSGREQILPRSEQQQEEQQSDNIEVQLTRNTVLVNGSVMPPNKFPENFRAALARALQNKTLQSDRVVVVKSKPETPYFHWITVTELIEQAGGVVTILREEEQQVIVPGT